MKTLLPSNLPSKNCCSGSASCEPPDLGRRRFIKATGLTATMLLVSRMNIMAGPFDKADFEKIVPSDKKLSKEWIASLYARGKPLSATGADLKFIGMPINGICTGQVYLGGDGQLWWWNLDGAKDATTEVNVEGLRFMNPSIAGSPQVQGFALAVGGKEFTLDAKGFKSVTFTNQYPMATVDYVDAACPVAVQLQAYTPFIPLNRDDSSYPVVVMRYTVKNTSPTVQDVALAGWVRNISKSDDQTALKYLATYSELEGMTAIECSADVKRAPDAGSIALGLFGRERPEIKDIARKQAGADGIFTEGNLKHGAVYELAAKERACASLGKRLKLQPGESRTLSFALSWRLPKVQFALSFAEKQLIGNNHYATLWPTAAGAAASVVAKEKELYGATQKWVDTWYDSTLPHWLLERTLLTVNCVQTQMGQRLSETGNTPEYYNFDEGVKCCPGNCTHVWHYAHGLARIFPEIERECRDKVEYGIGFDTKTGVMSHRYFGGEKFGDAIDGNCGTILRVLRESQMTTDYTFLSSIWHRVKISMNHVIRKWDADEDGMLVGSQHNTLDEPWFGQVHWLTNLYHASLKASAVMARQMNQPEVAERFERIVAKGAPAMVKLLWNEDFGYFVHKPGPAADEQHGSVNGCHIDQILGDSWLWNVGIDPILPKDKTHKTLESLWKYNFTPNVGDYRKTVTSGRWYAAEGNAGLIMCTFPHGKIEPKSGKKDYARYLNECMTGFEWQVAAHMIWEGMTEKGLAIGKAIYDRYLPKDRNPYNEIECSDHYSRAMASYGAYLAVCGYRYDGPEGKLAFGPRLTPENFRAAFTTAEGWGRFAQKVVGGQQTASLDLHYGKLTLKEFALDKAKGSAATQAKVEVAGTVVEVAFKAEADRYIVRFSKAITLTAGQELKITYTD